ncbi:LytS/YhcK type 5TM receptor domain-containing protein [Romboutsia sp.]|uniref:LytS/YhcK type 5TM receptor domain-containing protein n=1 Tax=Romboutsia sp. TaxID=1965302 RepID=UPI003F357146
MLNDLFVNSLILISFTFITGNILKDIPKPTANELYAKIILGIVGGLLGILVIFYNIKIDNTHIIIDLRMLVLMIVDYVGGMIPAVITGAIKQFN